MAKRDQKQSVEGIPAGTHSNFKSKKATQEKVTLLRGKLMGEGNTAKKRAGTQQAQIEPLQSPMSEGFELVRRAGMKESVRAERILDAVVEGFYTLDKDWCFAEANLAAARHFKRSAEELKGKNIWGLTGMPPEHPVYQTFHEATASGRPLQFEAESLINPGCWSRLSLQPHPDGLDVYFNDITGRKQAEEALRLSEQKYKDLVETSNSIIMTADKDLNITYMNDFGLKFFGYEASELIGQNVVGTTMPKKDAAGRDLASMAKAITKHPIDFETNVHQNMRKDGSLIWVSWTNKAKYDDKGKLVEILGVGNDITQLMQTRSALKENEEKFAKAFHANPAAMSISRLSDGLFLDVNSAFLRLFGYTYEEAVGHTTSELVWRSPGERKPKIERLLKEGRLGQHEVTFATKAGDAVDVLLSAELITVSGDRCILSTVIDITARKQAEEALQEANTRYQLVLAGSGAGIWDWDVINRRVVYSAHWKALCGYTDEEMSDAVEEWSGNIHPDDAARVMAAVHAHFEGKTAVFNEEYRLRRKDCSWMWVADRGLALRDADGRVMRMAGSAIDITERKQAEEKIRRDHETTVLANRILRAFVECEGEELFDKALAVVQEGLSSRHGVFGYISEPGHLICPSLSKMLDSCEVEGKCIHYPPEKWKGTWGSALTEKRSLYTNNASVVPPGHPIIHNNLATPILFHGEVIGLLNLANKEGGYTEQDKEAVEEIASRMAPVLYAWIQRKLREDERKRAEEALQKAHDELEVRVEERTMQLRRAIKNTTKERQHLYNVLETLPVYVCLLTPGYRMLFANKVFREWFGYDPDRTCYEFLFDRTEPCENCQTYDVLKTHAPQQWEWTGPNGQIYDIYDYPFKDTDGSTLILEMGMDITERKQSQKALEDLNETLEERVEDRTAELRGSREDLRRLNESLEQRVQERTQEVQQQAHQLRALASQLSRAERRERKRLSKILHDHIQQLIVAARMQLTWMKNESTGEQQAAVQGVDSILYETLNAARSLTMDLSPPILNEAGLIGGLSWLVARLRDQSRFTVRLDADSNAEPAAEDTRFLLFECVRELLLNAMKHSGVQEAEVTISRTSEGEIRVVISDQGIGFDPDVLHNRSAGDMTFGLFSIRERLAYIGGRMQVETAPGQGARFTLTVPGGMPADSASHQDAPTAQAEEAPTAFDVSRPCRVLICDDHKIVREGIIKLLQFEPDIEVIGQASDEAQAIALAQLHEPDVIIMDVNLGEMGGVETTRRILNTNPGIKIIGLSMHEDANISRAMHAAGAAAYLTKAGPAQDLIAAVKAFSSSK